MRASQNQAAALSIQESPAAALNLSSGNAGSCCKGWYPCFCFVVILFYESAESVPMSLGPGTWGRENRESVQGFIASCLSKLHSGRNIRDIHDRWEQNPSMEFPDFLLHTFILHKHPFFTTSLENFVLKICTALLSCHFERSEAESRNLLPPCSSVPLASQHRT